MSDLLLRYGLAAQAGCGGGRYLGVGRCQGMDGIY